MTGTPREVLDEVITESEAEVQPVEESQPVDQQSETSQEEVETFAEKGELQGRTPEELEEIHKNWQRAYTEKRQRETQELKQYREELERLKAAQTQQTDQKSVSQIHNEMGQAQEDLQLGQMSVQEYTDYMRNLMQEEARAIAREEFSTLTTQQREEQYQESAYQEFISADERGRLNANSPTADEALIKDVQDFLAVELQKHIDETGSAKDFPAGKLAKERISAYDARIDEIVKTRTKQSTQLAQARAVKAQKSSTRGSNAQSAPTHGTSIRDTLLEAVEQAGG
jgi:hypothetical protein